MQEPLVYQPAGSLFCVAVKYELLGSTLANGIKVGGLRVL